VPLLAPAIELVRDGAAIVPARATSARVRLPSVASDAASIEVSSVSARVSLAGAGPAAAEVADTMAVYRGALALVGGARGDLLYRATDQGFEDHVRLVAPPEGGTVRYSLELGGVAAGLRLIGGALEIVDAGGAPRIAMNTPIVVDASGHRHEVAVAVEGCAVDRSFAPPWGRAITAPGARTCTLALTLPHDLAYPAVLDPSWSSANVMKDKRAFFGIAALGDGKVLVAGGEDANDWKAGAEVFDPASGTWAKVGPLPQKRSEISAVRLGDGRVLTCGGSSTDGNGGYTTLSDCAAYDPAAGTWTPTKSLPAARERYRMNALADGRAFFSGGCKQAPNDVNCSLLFPNAGVYDATTDAWTVVPDMSTARYFHSHTLLPSGKVLVVGGVGPADADIDVSEEFDPATSTWAPPVKLIGPHAAHGAVLLPDGRAMVLGGATSSAFLTSTEIYDAGGWTQGPSLSVARTAACAGVLPSGAVAYILGSVPDPSSGFVLSASADVLAAGGTMFKSAGSAGVPRTSVGVAVLPDGRLLAAGGVSDVNSYDTTNAVDIFGDVGTGVTCKLDVDCGTGHCADGVCCNVACTDTCTSCKAVDTGKADGTCSPVLAGQNPKSACTKDLANVCGATGTCDGKGACAFAAAMTPCSGPTCEGGVLKTSACDGKGVCPPTTSVSCAPFACASGTACGTTCTDDTGCATGFKCNGGTCIGGKSPGSACLGAKECASGLCVDGYCCSSACTGQCEACDVKGKEGICTTVADVPHGMRAACKGKGTCGGKCDGTTGATCNYPGSLVVCDQACADGKESLSKCDGDGACKAQPAADCAPYVCGAGGTCKSGCSADADCAAGYACQGGVCAPKSAAVCQADGHTLLTPDGSKKDCGSYKCTKEGACLSTCNSTLDCTAGNTCGADRTCSPAAAAPSSDGGCGCAVPGREGTNGVALFAMVAVAAAFARRRRA
jgi:MYXO-CTERM domain-containing protein